MMYPVAVVGADIKKQLGPYWKSINHRWNDVTAWEQKNWRMNEEKCICPDSFRKWLDLWNIPEWQSLPEKPYKNLTGYIEENGIIRVYNYANPSGYWSHYQIGKNYTDFFLLKNGETAFQAAADDIDLEKDLKDIRKKLAIRWEEVRKDAEKEAPKPWNQSRALEMDKKDYIDLRSAEYVVPDAIVWNGCSPPETWLWLEKMEPLKRIAVFRNILHDLPPDEIITIVECHT